LPHSRSIDTTTLFLLLPPLSCRCCVPTT
jgi:hypothetical protein